jgi:hypothetical protein
LILDPEAVGDGMGILVEARLERGDTVTEILGGGMAVVVGYVLPQPAPEGLDPTGMKSGL